MPFSRVISRRVITRRTARHASSLRGAFFSLISSSSLAPIIIITRSIISSSREAWFAQTRESRDRFSLTPQASLPRWRCRVIFLHTIYHARSARAVDYHAASAWHEHFPTFPAHSAATRWRTISTRAGSFSDHSQELEDDASRELSLSFAHITPSLSRANTDAGTSFHRSSHAAPRATRRDARAAR